MLLFEPGYPCTRSALDMASAAARPALSGAKAYGSIKSMLLWSTMSDSKRANAAESFDG